MASKEMILQTVIFFCCLVLAPTSAEKVCKLQLKGEMDKGNKPMVVDSRIPIPAYPTKNDRSSLVIEAGKSIKLFCPGKTNQDSSQVVEAGVVQIRNKTVTQTRVPESIECVDDNTFKLQGKPVDFLDIECEQKPRASYNAVLKSDNGYKCHDGAERYEIGYLMGNKEFMRTIYLCHNKREAKTLWAHRIISPANHNSNRFVGDSRKVFKQGILYDDMQIGKEDPYSLKSQFTTLSSIVGVKKAEKYLSVKISDRKFLAKGHLIANADMLYKNEQESTYFLANVVPMWQQVNANPGNWFFVEEYVRHLAYEKQRQLHVWVGGIGVLEIEGKPFHLYRKQKSDKSFDLRLPVPKVIFKCVVDKDVKQGLCFLVVNNPYVGKSEVEALQNNYIVCNKYELCNKLSNKDDDPALGYLYCCKLSDFYKQNRKELGLNDFTEYITYAPLDLITMEKGSAPSKPLK